MRPKAGDPGQAEVSTRGTAGVNYLDGCWAVGESLETSTESSVPGDGCPVSPQAGVGHSQESALVSGHMASAGRDKYFSAWDLDEQNK